ncbi:hypothetical protein LQD23_21290 [Chromobacterium violaceum]|uniref:hypothetical protein n=1 Tax=Chromobacterium violaceum TaxID=536 RepID=UPI001E30E661|nr:hypothetical protein [Chromobacterium violaceum]MCD0494813.1 hypothetical protein [Chromobacterium violaceum]
MNASFTVYERETGRIVRDGNCPADWVALQAGEGEGAVEGCYSADAHYVPAGVPTPRPAMPCIRDGAHFSGLPVPCAVDIDGKRYDCADGVADLKFPLPGAYQVRISAWPYLDWVGEVESGN